MNHIPKALQPYERCIQYGPEVLNDAELLAVVLRTGTTGVTAVQMAENLLYHAGEEGLLYLYRASLPQLREIKGIGEIKAVQLQCIGELSKRIARHIAVASLDFQNPRSIADYYMEHVKTLDCEQVWCVFLDTKCRFICDRTISVGTVNMAIITPREIFIEALKNNAVSLVLLHNHPSGDPHPSKEDIQLTKRVKNAGELIGIGVVDHIVMGYNRYYSFSEHGIME